MFLPYLYVCAYLRTYLHVFLIVLPYIHICTYIRTCVSTIQLVWDYYERVRENDSDMFDPLMEHLTEYGQGRKLLVMQKQYRYVRTFVCTYGIYVCDLMYVSCQLILMYVCAYTYVLRMCVLTYIHTHVHIMYMYVHTYICTCTYVRIYVPTYVCT